MSATQQPVVEGCEAILSVHDVMPRTLDRVENLLDLLAGTGIPPAMLLVVPGLEWSGSGLARLRARAEAGHPVAAHGWTHRAPAPRGPWHRLHAALMSGHHAEHLSRPPDELRRIIRNAHAWFERAGLPEPDLYVPPAWALGALGSADLRSLPFRRYETLTGFLEVPSLRTIRAPLVGFEAETRFTAAAIRVSNGLNLMWASASARTLRVAIHPRDLELRLRKSLLEMIAKPWRWTNRLPD